MGFSIHNAIAVLEGHFGKKSPFIRTPKYNINATNTDLNKTKYQPKKRSRFTYLEMGFAVYFLFGIYAAFFGATSGDFGLFPFHILLFIGFCSISIFGMKQKY
jgi:hypothetical protein